MNQNHYFWSTAPIKFIYRSLLLRKLGQRNRMKLFSRTVSFPASPPHQKSCVSSFLQPTYNIGICSSGWEVPLRFFCTISAHFPQPSPLCSWAGKACACPWHPLSRHCIIKTKFALVSALMKFSFCLLVLLLPFRNVRHR